MKVRFTEFGLEEYNEDKQIWEPVVFKVPQKGNAIVSKNEDNTMKYRVTTTLLASHDRDQEIGEGVHRNLTLAGCPESWFEPVEQVEVGDYFKKSGAIYRVMSESEYKEWDWGVKKVAGDKGMPYEDDYHTHQIEHRKLSTDEIEQALIKEAKRRGYEKDNFKCLNGFGDTDHYIDWCDYDYAPADDRMLYGYKVVYKQGKWAEIIDDKWEAVHRTEDHSFVHSENMVIDMKGKRSMTKQEAQAIADALNNLDTND